MQIQAGQANLPSVGPALGQHGVNIMDFCKAFNAETQDKTGDLIPGEITVYADRSFTFVTKTPPAARLILKAANVKKGLVSLTAIKLVQFRLRIYVTAKIKMEDLNANTLDQAISMIRGTCVSMGIEVKG